MTPPPSNARTSVWYWSLDGVPTTLMYSRYSREVWCNGSVLDTDVRIRVRSARSPGTAVSGRPCVLLLFSLFSFLFVTRFPRSVRLENDQGLLVHTQRGGEFPQHFFTERGQKLASNVTYEPHNYSLTLELRGVASQNFTM